MANVLGCPLIFPTVSESSALGAVFLGWQEIGKITELSESTGKIQLKSQVLVQQNMQESYQKIYPVFVKMQKQLVNAYQPLAQLCEMLKVDKEKD